MRYRDHRSIISSNYKILFIYIYIIVGTYILIYNIKSNSVQSEDNINSSVLINEMTKKYLIFYIIFGIILISALRIKIQTFAERDIEIIKDNEWIDMNTDKVNISIYIFIGSILFILLVYNRNNINKYFGGKRNNKVVVVLYYVPWCENCKKIKPIWNKIKKEKVKDVEFIDINCNDEKNKDIIRREVIEKFPTIRGYDKNNNELAEFDGKKTVNEIKKFTKNCKKIEKN